MTTVTVLYDISTEGQVVNARVEKSTPKSIQFEKEALEILNKWKFKKPKKKVFNQQVSLELAPSL